MNFIVIQWYPTGILQKLNTIREIWPVFLTSQRNISKED